MIIKLLIERAVFFFNVYFRVAIYNCVLYVLHIIWQTNVRIRPDNPFYPIKSPLPQYAKI